MSEASFNEVAQRASDRVAGSNREKIFKGLLESLLDLLKPIVFSYFLQCHISKEKWIAREETCK